VSPKVGLARAVAMGAQQGIVSFAACVACVRVCLHALSLLRAHNSTLPAAGAHVAVHPPAAGAQADRGAQLL